eukprot:CAMPEP_0173408724 /NCGR_PEP_ID=MMETSP1356-20130122/70456_1 /TAXON_ID=77927 ORGANISM="Hemiselmis virescens, Strain PCC157" /NCGR_SAMPLE_ID=MMETSP1356 /ASSEMBLY_ACC=CAM_ASM_000847 /LENGTH=562 /DNA_ID=CAMNT_0014370079 /DNA_START=126 /DNA_END=1811 /DNA_ORIENTATION=-
MGEGGGNVHAPASGSSPPLKPTEGVVMESVAADSTEQHQLKDVADVVKWLGTLEFDDDDMLLYKKAFKRNAVDAIALDELSEADLKKMEITNPKHIKLIMTKRPGGIKMVTFGQLFMFADRLDWFLMITGAIFSMGHGVSMPLMTLFLGELMEGLFNPDVKEAADATRGTAIIFLILGFAIFICAYPELAFFKVSAVRQSVRIREEYLLAILRQDMSWFDQCKTNQLSTRLSGDVPAWIEGIDKIGTMFHFSTMFFAGFIFAFVKGWQLAIVILAAMPPLIVAGAIMAYFLSGITKKGQVAYAGAGGVAEETLANMRTVSSLSAEPQQTRKYDEKLARALGIGKSKALSTGGGIGVMIFCMFCMYSLGLWYGSKLITDEAENAQTGQTWTGGDVLTVFFSVLMGAMTIGQMLPGLEALSKGRGAAYRIVETINRVPEVDYESPKGEKLSTVRGDIRFESVRFCYPSRPDTPVLPALCLTIAPGQTAALVGSSGCGKSTTMQLLQRFYAPSSGRILLDGIDIATLNVAWLRSQFGLVSQEPVLFATTIKENIMYGREEGGEGG